MFKRKYKIEKLLVSPLSLTTGFNAIALLRTKNEAITCLQSCGRWEAYNLVSKHGIGGCFNDKYGGLSSFIESNNIIANVEVINGTHYISTPIKGAL
jgi:hypothetical protein